MKNWECEYRTCECLYKGVTSCQVAAEEESEVTVVLLVVYILQLEHTIYTIYEGSVTRPIC